MIKEKYVYRYLARYLYRLLLRDGTRYMISFFLLHLILYYFYKVSNKKNFNN